MADEAITLGPSRIDHARARRDWRKAIRPILQRDDGGRVIGPELEEDTERRYELCASIMRRLLGASNGSKTNNCGLVRELIAEVRSSIERMILAQDYVAFATKREMFHEALDGCAPALLPESKARFEAYAHVITQCKAFQTKWHFAQLRQLAEAVKNTNIDPGARHAAWQEVWGITKDRCDQERMEAEYSPDQSPIGAVPLREIRAFS